MSDTVAAKFITFEGGEGAGKTTQIKRLSAFLVGIGQAVLETREPGGSAGAEEIRKLLVEGAPDRWDAETESLLHFAARRDHLVKTIVPALEAGSWVLCDRFADSTIAYQGYGHGVSRRVLDQLYDLVSQGLSPDLTFILDLAEDAGLARASRRARSGVAVQEDRYERMDVVFHERLRAGFREIAAGEPQRCVVLDGGRDEDTIFAKIQSIIEERFLS